MSFFGSIKELLDSGEPELRKWFLVNTYFWPAAICAFYVFFVKSIGPAIMENRKPINLRYLMIMYNFFMVAAYLNATIGILYHGLRNNLLRLACQKVTVDVTDNNSPEYKVLTLCYHIYLLKYVELLDTVFFVLRKKDRYVTQLHIIHHTSLPIIAWYLMRTEISGYEVIPCMANSIIHIIMYFYYGLAAFGPTFQKYLWWKKYLTIIQMVQFLFIILLPLVVVNIPGCQMSKSGAFLVASFTALILALFYNFYSKTYFSENKNQSTAVTRKRK